MCVSIAKIGVKEPRGPSFAPTVVKSEAMHANCASTTASCDAIVETCAGTGEIFGATGVMPAEVELTII